MTSASSDLAAVLADLLRRRGLGLLEQRARLHGLLRDHAPNAVRDIRLLLTALDAGAPGRLQAAPDPSAAAATASEADRMVAMFGCGHDFARAAVETWGRALAALRGPASVPLSPVHAPVPLPAPGAADEGTSWFGRYGGIAVGLGLAVVALARWLGLF